MHLMLCMMYFRYLCGSSRKESDCAVWNNQHDKLRRLLHSRSSGDFIGLILLDCFVLRRKAAAQLNLRSLWATVGFIFSSYSSRTKKKKKKQNPTPTSSTDKKKLSSGCSGAERSQCLRELGWRVEGGETVFRSRCAVKPAQHFILKHSRPRQLVQRQTDVLMSALTWWKDDMDEEF